MYKLNTIMDYDIKRITKLVRKYTIIVFSLVVLKN